MPNFAESLKLKVGEIERPPLPPTGHYEFEITNYSFDKSNDEAWDIVGFSMVARDHDQDVDTSELGKAGGINAVRLTHRFLFPTADDDESIYNYKMTRKRLETFLWRHLGIPEGTTLQEAIDQSKGKRCIADVVHKQDKNDPDLYHANIGRTAPVV